MAPSKDRQTQCTFQQAKPHKSLEIPHIYYVYLLLLMSLSGSVQRKLLVLQKIWQEDAKTNNGQEGYFFNPYLLSCATTGHIQVQGLATPSTRATLGTQSHFGGIQKINNSRSKNDLMFLIKP